MKARTTVFGLILIFLILNVLDLVLTVLAVHSGKGFEGNPIMAHLLENSFAVFTAVKIAAGLFIALLLFKLYKKHVKAAKITAAVLIVAYVFIVANNMMITRAEEISYTNTAFYSEGGTIFFNATSGINEFGSKSAIEMNVLRWNFSKAQIPYKLQIVIQVKPYNGKYSYIQYNDGTGIKEIPVGLAVQRSFYFQYGTKNVTGYINIMRTSTTEYSIIVQFENVEAFRENPPSGIMEFTINYNTTGFYVSRYYISGAYPYYFATRCYNQIPEFGLFGINYAPAYDVVDGRISYQSLILKDVLTYNYSNGFGYISVDKQGDLPTKWIFEYINSSNKLNVIQENTYNHMSFNNLVINGYLVKAICKFKVSGIERQIILNNIPRPSTTTTTTPTVKFYFLDAETGSLLDNVSFTLRESFIGSSEVLNGTYDYSVTVDNLNDLEVYTYTASRAGYEVATGNVYYPPAGKETTVYVYLTPIKTPSNANNSVITFRVVSDFAGYQIALTDAAVTLNGETKLTNAQGYVSFEVAKNQTYSYLVSKDGYFSKAGEITATQDYHSVVVQLDPVTPATTPTPTATATPTPSTGTGGTTTIGGTGRGSLDNGINLLYENAEGLIGMAILVTFVSFTKMMGRR